MNHHGPGPITDGLNVTFSVSILMLSTNTRKRLRLFLVNGHPREAAEDLNWEMLSHANQTVVFYMGLENVAHICNSLKSHGRAANTPAALVEKGTTAMQRVFVGDLDSLPGLIADHQVRAPTLIMVGEVVALHNKLNWYRPGAEIGSL